MTSRQLAGKALTHIALSCAAALALSAQSAANDPWNTGGRKYSATQPSTPARVELVRGIAIRDDITLRDGTIEADIDPPTASRFAGLAFHVKDAANYDVVYFFADSLRWREVQYQPFYQGSPAWQLYPGPDYLREVAEEVAPPGKPMHVRIVFAGTRADVYVNSNKTPVLSIPELKGSAVEGHVGVWTGAPAATPLVFNNFSATQAHERVVALKKPAPRTDGRMLMKWRVSTRLASPDTIVAPTVITPELHEALRTARPANTESDGLMSLTRIVGNPGGAQVENMPGGTGWGLALARTTLTSRGAGSTQLHVGYTEGIAIFLNNELIYSGTHPYGGSPELGRVIGEPNDITLNLRNGENDLVFAVTDRAFGWGFRARIDKSSSIRVD